MRVGWRTITVGAVFLAFMWATAFVAGLSEGTAAPRAALHAFMELALVVVGTTVIIGLISWASKDSDR